MGAELPIAADQARPPLQLASYAECYCGQVEIFDRRVGLPAGWRPNADGSAVKCPDCASAAEPLPLLPELELEQPRLIPADAKGGHHGCRLFHSVVAPGAVVLRIHAGARPVGPAETDRPVHFLARTADLDELIAALEQIRASITSKGEK